MSASRALAHGVDRSAHRACPRAAATKPTAAATARLSLGVAGVLTIAVCLVGLVVRVGFAAWARRWLAFPFAGVPARPAEAAAIFAHNLHALAAVGGLLLVAQAPHWGTRIGPGAVQRALRSGGEVVLGAAVAANVIVVGASLGAYRSRMVRAALPHGPVELAADSLALALYLQGRRQPLAVRRVLATFALSVALLALAAVLETYVNL